MENLVDEFTVNKKLIKIFYDSEPESPREWDNLANMICWHRNYKLGDKHDWKSPDDFLEWYHENEKNIAVILPLYLYDHSGITMRTAKFNDPWDSGQVGYIYVTKEKVRSEYNKKNITKSLLEKVRKNLETEVQVYDQYLTGDIYGYEVYRPIDDGEEFLDSCWGFYGLDNVKKEATEVANHYKE